METNQAVPMIPPVYSTTDIAVINTNLGYIQRDIAGINQAIKELSGVYATKAFVDDSLKAIDLRLTEVEKTKNFQSYINPTIGLIVGSVITFLVISFLTKH